MSVINVMNLKAKNKIIISGKIILANEEFETDKKTAAYLIDVGSCVQVGVRKEKEIIKPEKIVESEE